MSSFGRNNGSQDPAKNCSFISNRKQIACRLCDQVLDSTSSLIAHIKSHIIQEDIAPVGRDRYFLQNPAVNPRFATTPSVLPLTTAPNFSLILGGGSSSGGPRPIDIGIGSHSMSHSPCDLPRVSSIGDGANRSGSKLGKRKRDCMEEAVSPVDGTTRPFLNQLDRPIPKVMDFEMGNDNGLDLTLKL